MELMSHECEHDGTLRSKVASTPEPLINNWTGQTAVELYVTIVHHSVADIERYEFNEINFLARLPSREKPFEAGKRRLV